MTTATTEDTILIKRCKTHPEKNNYYDGITAFGLISHTSLIVHPP